MKNKRYKNPYFWFGLIGVVLAAMGVNPEMLTSWESLATALQEFIQNPFMIGSVIMAVTGVIIDPTTKGMRDVKGEKKVVK